MPSTRTVVSPSNGGNKDATQPARTRFRLDIQGLRAIAVAGVVFYHLWPHRLPGGFVGVDVFFVISGFLITSHLVRKPPRTLTDILNFWARRVKRLLPASLSVITITGITAFFLAPVTTWHDTGKQIIASAGYIQNWILATDSVDYLAADNKPTAIQHFWSLSVEEQFYFVWPIVIALVVALSVRKRFRQSIALTTAVGLVLLASFTYSVWFTAHEPAMAYFVTTTRIWELAVGGLTALLSADRPASSTLNRLVLAWLGIAGLALSFIIITGKLPFPGLIALLPTLSTAAVIAANAEGIASPTRWLSMRPVQFVGNTSYSIYLWHWPLIVLLPAVFGNLRWWHKLGIIAVVLILAYFTMLLIEQKLRKTRFFATNTRTFATAACAMAVAMAVGFSLSALANVRSDQSRDRLEQAIAEADPCLGAGAIDERAKDPAACPEPNTPLQDPAAAKTDKSDAYKDGCWSHAPFAEHPICTYGTGKKKVALVGNSHAGHWLPALQVLAKQNDWTIDTYLVDTCNPSTATQKFDTKEKSSGCKDYGKWVKAQTSSGKYNAVFTSNRQVNPVEGHTLADTEQPAADGYKPLLAAWSESETPVVVLKDTPFPLRAKLNIPDCVAEHGPTSNACNGTPETWKPLDPLTTAAKQAPHKLQSIVDADPMFCPDDVCRSTIGGVIVYFDGSHMTSHYSKTLAPWLAWVFHGVGCPGRG